VTFLPRLWSALLLLPLAACSSMPEQPAPARIPPSLLVLCPAISQPPEPLVDPARLEWEVDAVLLYETCRARHKALSEALQSTPTATK
jgi:hypothetical protein